MRKHFTCSQGHRWEVSLDGQFSAAVECIVCPACGSAAETVGPVDSDQDGKTAIPASEQSATTDWAPIPGYEILGVLGQGGMGVVYKAHHLRLNRVVALKMIPQARVGLSQLDRFRLEALAAARLQHPHIVQIYEIGQQADRPYLSLEFVEGGSLDRKLAGVPQPARAAAPLLETLARAMHYAHERGIVHRDLKPSNILLSADGTPKITDFGLAKQLDAEMDQTQTGAVLGTPSYMAPEQAQGQKHLIGPLSDVYALGAILYEVLTGRPPFRGTTTLETLEQVRSQEPVPPRRLQAHVPRDLETVCLKCLEKEPSKRYPSALSLAQDLRRFLNKEPIRARPVRLDERIGRWCRRNPVVAVLLAAVALTLLLGTAVASWFAVEAAANARQANTQRDRAENNAAKALEQQQRAEENLKKARQAVRDSFTLLSEAKLRDVPGLQPLRNSLLELASKYLQDLREQAAGDPSLLTELAEAHYNVGKMASELGDNNKALAAHEQARTLFEDLRRQAANDTQLQRKLAITYGQIALQQERLGHLEDALQSQQNALAITLQLYRDHSADRDVQRSLAAAYHHLGLRQLQTGRLEEARASYEKALSLRKQLVSDRPTETTLSQELADTYNATAVVLARTGRCGEAISFFQQAQTLRQELAHARPLVLSFQQALAASHHNLGRLYQTTGQLIQALEAYQQALSIREKLARDNPKIPGYRSDVAKGYTWIGVVQAKLGRLSEALDSHQQAVRLAEALVQEYPADVYFKNELAVNTIHRGEAQAASGHHTEALHSFEQARALAAKLAEADPKHADYRAVLARSNAALGAVFSKISQPAKALPYYEQARSIQEKLVQDNAAESDFRSWLARTWNGIGQAEAQLGHTAEAMAAYRAAIDRQRSALEHFPEAIEYRQLLSEHYRHLAALQRELARPAEAAATSMEQKQLWPHEPDELYQLARELARCIPLVGKGRAELSVQEQAERQRYADQALETLRQAIDQGFQDVERLQNEPDFAPLRQQADFQKLLKELQEAQT